MSKTTTMTVRISGVLQDFVASNVGKDGRYENISEYMRDLIRQDLARHDAESFARLKAELQHAYAADESTYEPLTAQDIFERNPS